MIEPSVKAMVHRIAMGVPKKRIPHFKDPQGESIAKELGIEYIGVWPGTDYFTFNEPSKGSTFMGKSLSDVRRKLEEIQRSFSVH